MIQVIGLVVRGYTLTFLDLTWDIADTTERVTDYTFRVRRSESPAGPFAYASPPLTNQFTYRDKKVDLFSKWRVYYYDVEVTKTATKDTSYSPVSYFGAQPDRVTLEMMRQHQLQLKINTGSPSLIFKKRTSGPHCPECFDPMLRRTIKSDCTFCFEWKWSGGYHAPIPTFINYSPTIKARQVSQVVETEPSQKMLDMTGYPIIQPSDVIIDLTNRRFRVQSVNCHEHQLFVFRQQPSVTEIDRTDVIYKMPIDVTLFPNKRDQELYPFPADFGRIELDIKPDFEG